MILALGAANGNKRKAANIDQSRKFGGKPSASTIIRNYEILRQTGSFQQQRQRTPSVSTSLRTDVLAFMAANPQASVRDVAAQAPISKSTVWRILKDSDFHPYHVSLHQCLEDRDFQNRLDFSNWILTKSEESPDFLSNVMWTDEANFCRNGQVNLHNAHYWSDSNPHWVKRTRHQYQWSFNVWCGIYAGTIIGPIFFDQTLTGQRYVNEILEGTVDRCLSEVPLSRLPLMWYQQDGAPAHSSSRARNWLDATFQAQWIGRHGPVNWPARSPDLSPLDFFLWGYVKDRVYTTETKTSDELKAKITDVCSTIPPSIIKKATEDVIKRAQYCVAAEGDLFEHAL